MSQLEEMWSAGKYEDLIPELTEYAQNEKAAGVRLVLDYMLATSLCRVPGSQNDGAVLLEMIPFVYRNISIENYERILKEKTNCTAPTQTIAQLEWKRPGVEGKGGRESGAGANLTRRKLLERLEEYNNRLYPMSGKTPKLKVFEEMAGYDYKAIRRGHFIVVGAFRKKELRPKAALLEETLSRFLTQFEMTAPKYYTSVYLMDDRYSMVRFARKHHGIDIPPTMWGYTFAYDGSIVMNASGGMGTVGHEIFHALLNNNFPQSPPWLNEGFSALFEEFTWTENKMVGTFRGDHWRIEYLHRAPGDRPSLSELIAMDWNAFDASHSIRDLHTNHTTAKFFALYLQNKLQKLESVYQAFKNEDFRKGDARLVEKYKNVLEKTLDNTPIEEIEKDFQRWLEFQF